MSFIAEYASKVLEGYGTRLGVKRASYFEFNSIKMGVIELPAQCSTIVLGNIQILSVFRENIDTILTELLNRGYSMLLVTHYDSRYFAAFEALGFTQMGEPWFNTRSDNTIRLYGINLNKWNDGKNSDQ